MSYPSSTSPYAPCKLTGNTSILLWVQQKRHIRMSQHYTTSHIPYMAAWAISKFTHIWSILANLWDFLYYMREVTIHTMDYINAATTGILSLHVLPVEDLSEMLPHIKETLPSTLYLSISSEDALHFYIYLHTHVLIADEQFLLLISVPLQNCAQQLEIYEMFNLAIPQGNFLAHYSIQNRYLGIMHDESSAVRNFRKSIQNMPKGQHTI